MRFNDDFTDGRYGRNALQEDDIKIYPGDSVTVEMAGFGLDVARKTSLNNIFRMLKGI
ncbi:MAG: hypothetical protein JWR50_1152 [Mucilaginibacter sp.]|nr:hypothetical protein [Mucilaginibacter sp.]